MASDYLASIQRNGGLRGATEPGSSVVAVIVRIEEE